MKIIVQAYDYGRIGGIASYLFNFLTSAINQGTSIQLVTSKKENLPEIAGLAIKTFPLSKNRFSLLNWSIQCKKYIEFLVDKGEADVVLIHTPPLIPGFFISEKIPYIFTPHSTYYTELQNIGRNEYYSSGRSILELRLRSVIESIIFNKAQGFIVLTEEAKKSLILQGMSPEAIRIIPNGVNTHNFSPISTKKTYDVIFCGRIEERKGSRSMVPVIQELVKRKPDIKIVVVGFGEDEEFVRESLKDQVGTGNVHFTGRITNDEAKNYYAKSRLYLSCSYFEGLPTTCLEAMSMRLPTIVWDMDFYQGVVIEGKTGKKVHPKDHKRMIETTIDLLNNKELIARMGKTSRKKIIEEYNWVEITSQIIKFTRDVSN